MPYKVPSGLRAIDQLRHTDEGTYVRTCYISAYSRFPGLVANSRGMGTFCAIDLDTGARRER